MGRKGTATRAMTQPRARVYEDVEPQWSPDGKRIVFVHLDVAGNLGAIFTVRPNGHRLRQLTPWELDA